MPRTGYKSNDHLSIELDRWQGFAPGDFIAGRITRKALLSDAKATVTLRLRGRAKCKVSIKMQHGSANYRNRFDFFDDSNCAWTLFEGPLAITSKSGPQSWQFKAQIPTRPSAASVAAGGKPDTCFLPLTEAAVRDQALPDVFYYKGTNFWSSTTMFGYVEYYLTAELVPSKGSSRTATLPLFVRTPMPKSLATATDFVLRKDSLPFSIPHPNMANEKRGFGAKTKALFGGSSRPELKLALCVEYPTHLQLGSRVPLCLRVLSSDDCVAFSADNQPLQCQLTSFNLTLNSTTAVICPGTMSVKRPTRTVKYEFSPKSSLLSATDKPIFLPLGASSESLDIGEMLQIVLEDDGISLMGQRHRKRFSPKLVPDMKTYCITHTHTLHWELEFSILGQSQQKKMKGQASITLLSSDRGQVERAMADLSDDERQAIFKAVIVGTETGLEALDLVSEIVQAFAS